MPIIFPSGPKRLTRAVLAIAVVLTPAIGTNRAVALTPSVCAGRSAAALDRLFQGEVGRVVGSDYVRPYAMPNGTTLMLMQDVFLSGKAANRPVTNLRRAAFAHNAGVLLSADGCVLRTLTGTRSYIGNSRTKPLSRWFWAMGGAIGADGNLHVMVAEFRNPNRTGAAMGAAPVGTWHATIDPVTLTVRSFKPAVDSSTALYGWAVASDKAFTYLYSHCYRQFVPGEFLGHDLACAGDVRVARTPRGRFDLPMEYYADGTWQSDPTSATPLPFPGHREINPVSIQNLDGTFVSVVKDGDWWGTTIYVDTSPTAVGPWTRAATVVPPTKCAECNTYFASLMPWRQADGSLVVAISNNAWDMTKVAYAKPWIYRNSFIDVALG